MRLVVDASTVIAHSRIGMLDFLQSAADEVLLPEAAYEEVSGEPPDRPGVQELAKAGWLRSHRVVDTARVTALRERMGHGEAEAIVLAREVSADAVVLDDALARRVARAEGQPVVGLLGLLIHAKQAGRVKLVRPVLDALVSAGFYIDKALYDHVLAEAGEAPKA